MLPVPPPSPLAVDFPDRLESLRREAAALGHGDIDYIIEMAVQIAEKRINAEAMRPAGERDRLRTVATGGTDARACPAP